MRNKLEGGEVLYWVCRCGRKHSPKKETKPMNLERVVDSILQYLEWLQGQGKSIPRSDAVSVYLDTVVKPLQEETTGAARKADVLDKPA